jgi:hypothetical protein
LDNLLEALSNLLYLIRRSLDDPAKAKAYLDMADKVLIDMAANRPPTSAGDADKSMRITTRGPLLAYLLHHKLDDEMS